ncbi:Uncharacterised protein [Mycobacteroides abscessus subsp. abscessus]|nr:Uncharacterised protein [Mycobacteroides abscessus subsp. abscessus]
MSGIGLEFLDDLVIEAVCFIGQFLLPLQHDHHRTVRVELSEDLPRMHHRDHRGGVLRGHGDRVGFAHLVQRWGDDVQDDRDAQPEENDRNGQCADKPRDTWRARGVVTATVPHADFTRQ